MGVVPGPEYTKTLSRFEDNIFDGHVARWRRGLFFRCLPRLLTSYINLEIPKMSNSKEDQAAASSVDDDDDEPDEW